MSHPEQLKFVSQVREEFSEFFDGKKIIEMGSWDVNGTVRQHFDNCDYTGVDVAEGQGVDLVCPGQLVEEPSNSYDVAISCECFEHNPFWLETFINMTRMVKPGGLCIFTCASTGRREHGTRRMAISNSLSAKVGWFADYYRNLNEADFRKAINLDFHFSHHFFHENIYSRDLYFCGVKNAPGVDGCHADRMERLQKAAKEIRATQTVPPYRKLKTRLKWMYNKAFIGIAGEKAHRNFDYHRKRLTKRNDRRVA